MKTAATTEITNAQNPSTESTENVAKEEGLKLTIRRVRVSSMVKAGAGVAPFPGHCIGTW